MTPEQRIVGASLIATRETLSAGIAQIDAALVAMGFDIGLPEAEECDHEGAYDRHTTLDDGPDDWYCPKCKRRQQEPFHPEE